MAASFQSGFTRKPEITYVTYRTQAKRKIFSTLW